MAYKRPNFTLFYLDELLVGVVSKIKANSVWGALRGLETFTQLTDLTDDKKVTKR